MTRYEYLINKADELLNRAIQETNVSLKAFYYNAGKGFKLKAQRLTVEEAGEQAK